MVCDTTAAEKYLQINLNYFINFQFDSVHIPSVIDFFKHSEKYLRGRNIW